MERMTTSRFYLSMSLLIIALVWWAGIAGCGQSLSTAQVRGKVVFKGSSLPKAGIRMVRLEPMADTTAAVRKGASGSINDDGSFEVYTRRPGDGVLLGKYAVTFVFCKGSTDQQSLIPGKYTKAATTPFHLTVEDDTDDLEYELEPIGPTAR
jgi:hypothetical protein